MKKSLLLAWMLTACVMGAFAQQEKPKKEFLLTLSESTVQLNPGDTKEVTLSLIRSNAFAKSKAKLGISSALPDGISLTYDPAEGNVDSSVIKIAVGKEVKPGTYTLLPNCIINNKSKGTMLKIVVGDGQQSQSR